MGNKIKLPSPTGIGYTCWVYNGTDKVGDPHTIKMPNVIKGRKTVRLHETVKLKYTKKGWIGKKCDVKNIKNETP